MSRLMSWAEARQVVERPRWLLVWAHAAMLAVQLAALFAELARH